MNEEMLIGQVIRLALQDLVSENSSYRISAYSFLYRKHRKGVYSLMDYNNIDSDYLVKRYYGSLEPVKKIEKELKLKVERKKRKYERK